MEVMKMKKHLSALSGLLILGIAIAFAQPLNPEVPPPPERPAPKELIETLRKVRLIEELKLTEEQSVKFFPKLNEIREAREKFDQERKALIDELRDLLGKEKKPADQINAKIDKLFQLEEEFNNKESGLKKELRKILSPEQQARFILFQLRFEREMREMIQDIRERRQERIRRRERMEW
jgi:Spy/CpxP family protein refolding chaperone